MPTYMVSPGKFRKILHAFPRNGKAEIRVEASAPIDIYVIGADELGAFRSGRPFGGFKFTNRAELEKSLDLSSRLDDDNDWYLILDNGSDRPVAAHYEVYY